MNMWSKPRGNRRPRRPADNGKDPLDQDYGFGYSEEGRPITGIEDGQLDDPNAEIFEPKGATTYHDLAKVKGIRMCEPDQHDLQPDGEAGDDIPGHQAMKCRRCPFGVLVAQN